MTTTLADEELRNEAIARIKRKSDLVVHLLMYGTVNGLLVVVWAVTGAGFFWPVFPIVGWGIGVVGHVWDAFRRPPTEERIRREMDRLR